MGVVLVIGLGILGLGHLMRVPWQARFLMLGLVYVAVLAIQIALPAEHPLRVATGGSPQEWVLLGILFAVALIYRDVLRRVRSRAQSVAAGRASPTAPTGGTFSDDELDRYARHITLPEVGGTGQCKLKAASVLVIGAGGLGSPILLYLAAAGIGRLGVIDADTVSLSNLQRQVIHRDQDQGMPKVFSAQKAITALNPNVDLRPYNRELTGDIAETLFAEYDLVLDGTDSFATRALVNRAAVATGTPLIAGAISAWEGQITLYDPAAGAPCMACVFPQAPADGLTQTCAQTGVIGALPGIIGTMMALEAVKAITGAGTGLRGRMMIYDALHAETRIIGVKRQPNCPVCGAE